MSKIGELLKEQIYPAIYENVDRALPEFGFKQMQTGRGYVSTKGAKITGEEGSPGKVYYYENNPGYLIDYTRGSISIWNYLQDRDSLDNKQVLHKLSELSGVALPGYSPEDEEKYKEYRERAEIWESANDYFIRELHLIETATDIAKKAVKYLKDERGYTLRDLRAPRPGDDQEINEVSTTMELGLIQSKTNLYTYLLKQGFNEATVRDTIKLTGDGKKGIGYTHFITIPYRNQRGDIVGIAVRAIDKKAEPKYLYSTGLTKDNLLFNIRNVSRKDGEIVIVEGLLDCMAATARGIRNVVALGGASLNEKQAGLINKLGVKRVTLCLDNDKAGQEATMRAIEVIRGSGVNYVYIVTLPDLGGGKTDPDRLIKEKGGGALQTAIDQALPYYLFLLNNVFEKYSIIQDSRGALTHKEVDKLLEEVVLISEKIPEPISRDQYKNTLIEHDAIKELGITAESLAITVDRLTSTKAKEDQAKALEDLLTKVKDYQDKGETDKALDLLDSKVKEVRLKDKATEFSSLMIPIKEAELRERQAKKPESLNSGYTIGGEELLLPSGAISIFSAPTSHGKTTYLINMALNVATAYPDKETYLFSYEEDGDTVLINTLNTYLDEELSGNNRTTLKNYFAGHNKKILSTKKDKFFKELIETRRLNIHYSSYNSDTLIEAIRYLHKHAKPGAIFIDYIQLLNLPEGKYKTYSRQEEIKEICIALKDVAVETGLPIILGAQFNRTVENQLQLYANKIGEAGDIERIANLIVGFWNNNFKPLGSEGELKEINSKGLTTPNTLYATILKNRGGKVGLEEILSFNGNTGKIKNQDSFNGIDFK